jgi:uncharacterized membrane protein YcaP (DUF421 family)
VDSVIRALVVYLLLLVLFRIAGKRSLAQTTPFDFVLLLIIAEAIQQALLDDDSSMTNGFLVVLTLVSANIGISVLKQRWPRAAKVIDSAPLVIVDEGKLQRQRMDRERVDETDILHAGRQLEGLARLDQIRYAVLEQSGGITVIPKEKDKQEWNAGADHAGNGEPSRGTESGNRVRRLPHRFRAPIPRPPSDASPHPRNAS